MGDVECLVCFCLAGWQAGGVAHGDSALCQRVRVRGAVEKAFAVARKCYNESLSSFPAARSPEQNASLSVHFERVYSRETVKPVQQLAVTHLLQRVGA